MASSQASAAQVDLACKYILPPRTHLTPLLTHTCNISSGHTPISNPHQINVSVMFYNIQFKLEYQLYAQVKNKISMEKNANLLVKKTTNLNQFC